MQLVFILPSGSYVTQYKHQNLVLEDRVLSNQPDKLRETS